MHFNWNYRYSNLSQFFDDFLSLLSTLRNERDHLTVMAMVKKKTDLQNPVEEEYSSVVTPYALLFIRRQLSLKDKVVVVSESSNSYQVSSSAGTVLFICIYFTYM